MSAVTVPSRSLDQRMAALQRANEIRIKRARFKKHLRETVNPRQVVADVLEQPEDYLAGMKVVALLTAIPIIGRVKATRMLRTCLISESKTIGGLSERQRRVLANEICPGGGA